MPPRLVRRDDSCLCVCRCSTTQHTAAMLLCLARRRACCCLPSLPGPCCGCSLRGNPMLLLALAAADCWPGPLAHAWRTVCYMCMLGRGGTHPMPSNVMCWAGTLQGQQGCLVAWRAPAGGALPCRPPPGWRHVQTCTLKAIQALSPRTLGRENPAPAARPPTGWLASRADVRAQGHPGRDQGPTQAGQPGCPAAVAWQQQWQKQQPAAGPNRAGQPGCLAAVFAAASGWTGLRKRLD